MYHKLIKYTGSCGLRSPLKVVKYTQFEMFGVKAAFKSLDQLSLIIEWIVTLSFNNVKVKLKFTFKLEGNIYQLSFSEMFI